MKLVSIAALLSSLIQISTAEESIILRHRKNSIKKDFIYSCKKAINSFAKDDTIITQHEITSFLEEYCIDSKICAKEYETAFQILNPYIQIAFAKFVCDADYACRDKVTQETFGYHVTDRYSLEFESRVDGFCNALYNLGEEYHGGHIGYGDNSHEPTLSPVSEWEYFTPTGAPLVEFDTITTSPTKAPTLQPTFTMSSMPTVSTESPSIAPTFTEEYQVDFAYIVGLESNQSENNDSILDDLSSAIQQVLLQGMLNSSANSRRLVKLHPDLRNAIQHLRSEDVTCPESFESQYCRRMISQVTLLVNLDRYSLQSVEANVRSSIESSMAPNGSFLSFVEDEQVKEIQYLQSSNDSILNRSTTTSSLGDKGKAGIAVASAIIVLASLFIASRRKRPVDDHGHSQEESVMEEVADELFAKNLNMDLNSLEEGQESNLLDAKSIFVGDMMNQESKSLLAGSMSDFAKQSMISESFCESNSSVYTDDVNITIDTGGWNAVGATANAFDEVSSVSDSDSSRLDLSYEEDEENGSGTPIGNSKTIIDFIAGPWQHAESLSSISGPSPHSRESKETLETKELPLKENILMPDDISNSSSLHSNIEDRPVLDTPERLKKGWKGKVSLFRKNDGDERFTKSLALQEDSSVSRSNYSVMSSEDDESGWSTTSDSLASKNNISINHKIGNLIEANDWKGLIDTSLVKDYDDHSA